MPFRAKVFGVAQSSPCAIRYVVTYAQRCTLRAGILCSTWRWNYAKYSVWSHPTSLSEPVLILKPKLLTHVRLVSRPYINELCRGGGGGGCAHYQKCHPVHLRKLNLEWLFIQFKKPSTKSFLVATWYRPLELKNRCDEWILKTSGETWITAAWSSIRCEL